jgi:peptidoglycan/xylan/chitin deacetylase (PgdA/CDA1 family)
LQRPILGWDFPKNGYSVICATAATTLVTSEPTFARGLKELGFQATFFITQAWMKDTSDFLTWEETAEIHRMGFEIGNHSWTHSDFSKPENGTRLGEELQMVEKELAKVGVPKPVSFAWCGNTFGPEAIEQLRRNGYRLARRGMQPEKQYGEIHVGPSLDVTKHHPLLIPTTGDAYPAWTLEHFKRVLSSAKPGEIVVLQFHGAPDLKHPWVNTPPVHDLSEAERIPRDCDTRPIAVLQLVTIA